MKNYIITVNGKAYEVQVEELNSSQPTFAAPAAVQTAPAPRPAAPAAAPAPAATTVTQAAPAPAKPAPSGAQGSVQVKSPMPGSIVDIKVEVGQKVSAGAILCILEAMKMENEILSPSDGTIASINVAKGASVNTGELLITLN